MSVETKQGGKSDATDFDLKVELSNLVTNQVIPQSIAEKLEMRIVEKQVDITKDQLHTLAEKIHGLLKGYKMNGSVPTFNESKTEARRPSNDSNKRGNSFDKNPQSSQDIQDFLNKFEELHQKIELLELEKNQKRSQIDDQESKLKQDTNELIFPYDEHISTETLTNDPLQFIPTDPESVIILMNWIQYLINRCGHGHLEKILDYYVDVDWITDDVKISLLEYANGVTEGVDLVTESSPKKKEAKTANLPSKDHIQSYLYIQRLKGKKIEKHFVERINGELARIEKKVDTYYHTQ